MKNISKKSPNTANVLVNVLYTWLQLCDKLEIPCETNNESKKLWVEHLERFMKLEKVGKNKGQKWKVIEVFDTPKDKSVYVHNAPYADPAKELLLEYFYNNCNEEGILYVTKLKLKVVLGLCNENIYCSESKKINIFRKMHPETTDTDTVALKSAMNLCHKAENEIIKTVLETLSRDTLSRRKYIEFSDVYWLHNKNREASAKEKEIIDKYSLIAIKRMGYKNKSMVSYKKEWKKFERIRRKLIAEYEDKYGITGSDRIGRITEKYRIVFMKIQAEFYEKNCTKINKEVMNNKINSKINKLISNYVSGENEYIKLCEDAEYIHWPTAKDKSRMVKNIPIDKRPLQKIIIAKNSEIAKKVISFLLDLKTTSLLSAN